MSTDECILCDIFRSWSIAHGAIDIIQNRGVELLEEFRECITISSLGKLGDTHILNAQLIDVAASRVVKRVKGDRIAEVMAVLASADDGKDEEEEA